MESKPVQSTKPPTIQSYKYMPYGPDRRGGGAIVHCRYEIVLKERNPKLVDVGKYLKENDCTEELFQKVLVTHALSKCTSVSETEIGDI